jgi:hypothetical protein
MCLPRENLRPATISILDGNKSLCAREHKTSAAELSSMRPEFSAAAAAMDATMRECIFALEIYRFAPTQTI